jgi:hypothetical protein
VPCCYQQSAVPPAAPTAKAGTKSSANLENGPSLDPIQAQQAAEAAAAEAKRQLLLSKSMKAAEDEAKRAAEAKRQAEAAAAATAAAAAGPAKPVSSKRRYKLLSSYPLMSPNMRREEWSLSQFAVEKRLHKGYASEVYKVWGPSSEIDRLGYSRSRSRGNHGQQQEPAGAAACLHNTGSSLAINTCQKPDNFKFKAAWFSPT